MAYRQDFGLQEMANGMIQSIEKFQHLEDCRIAYLTSSKGKSSNGIVVHADCEKVNEKIKALCGIDFIITFYEPTLEGWTDAQRAALVEHELMHIGFDPQTHGCKLIPHDVQDFEAILVKYGLDWAAPNAEVQHVPD